MAEQRRSNNRRSNSTSNERRNGASSNSDLSARDAIARVRQELPQLLGRPIEAVLGVERDEESGWRVIVASVDRAREMGINWWEADPRLNAEAQQNQLESENRELRERLDRLERLLDAPKQRGQSSTKGNDARRR